MGLSELLERILDRIPFDERFYKYIVGYSSGLINFFVIGYVIHGVVFGFKELTYSQIIISFVISSIITLIGIIFFYVFFSIKRIVFNRLGADIDVLSDYEEFEKAYFLATLTNLWMGYNFFGVYFNPSNIIFKLETFNSINYIKSQYQIAFVFTSIIFTLFDLADLAWPRLFKNPNRNKS